MKKPLKIPQRNLLLLLAAALAVLGAAAGWFWVDNNFERRIRQVETGPSEAARRNAFLAAERFLRRLDVEVHSRPDRALLIDLPPPTDLLVVRGPGPLNATRQASLLDWLQRGGHLLVEAMRPYADGEAPHDDDFLAGLGVTLAVDPTIPAGRQAVAEIGGAASGRALQVAFLSRWFLRAVDDRHERAVMADGQTRLLQYRIGDGMLTVASDLLFLTNAGIGDHDHALFLHGLSADATRVWLLYDQALPSLPALLFSAAPQALIASATLLAALLWHIGGRLGPLLPEPEPGRRDLMVHLEAASALVWRLGGGADQLDAARRRIEHAWLARHPALAAQDADTRARRIAERAGLRAEDVAEALAGVTENREQALVARARTLQQLRRPR